MALLDDPDLLLNCLPAPAASLDNLHPPGNAIGRMTIHTTSKPPSSHPRKAALAGGLLFLIRRCRLVRALLLGRLGGPNRRDRFAAMPRIVIRPCCADILRAQDQAAIGLDLVG